MNDLIRELELLGADVDWPATPAFSPRAAARAGAPAPLAAPAAAWRWSSRWPCWRSPPARWRPPA